ncbi:DEAD/DEAH box helicase [Lutibacter sp. HS1-25]|uniref:DEAD/DEAH box helicase n=1 Tax=Lutibacter sp. HS1-25 TaxID=2485000 RepID=UPI001011BC71|nr:DEAD/DEAH box helicase [Lutibacter sp. HS1-25]RXP61904.1 DEAD/DEAH box helicase [Lutibacter sp. HS1-25]
MANNIKTQQDILEKLNIFELNEMQKEAIPVIENNTNTVVLSPTGTGKTLAFLLPIIENLDPESSEIQALILVPSRELAIQIEQVIRSMGSGYKVNAVYGGRSMAKDKIELKHIPAILIGTPGRISDHFLNERFSKKFIKTLVLDEFDKCLEIGFENEMKEIVGYMSNINKRILTSATKGVKIPSFVRLDKPVIIDYLKEKTASKLSVKTIVSTSKNKLSALLDVINNNTSQPGIIFCNLKDSVEIVGDFLTKNKISFGCFTGGMDQKDRERSLIKFRNGTYQVIVATDLAARGIDIPEVKYIVHYELPMNGDDFIHRNGRTARVSETGTAYILKWDKENLPDFINNSQIEKLASKRVNNTPYWETLFISGGRKDKISKGDIAGMFLKQGNILNEQLGVIELKQDCTFVAVPVSIADELVEKLNNTKLKKKKVRVFIV